MKMKFGAIVVDGSGKIGGQVASKNKSGNYLRTKVTPINRKTDAQMAVRSQLSYLSKAWAGLSEANRGSFNGAVGAYQKTNIFGDLKSPSGFNLFVKLNSVALAVGTALLTTCPAPASTGSVGAFTIVADNSSNTLVATLPDLDLETGDLKIEATPAYSAGKSFIESEYRTIGYAAAAASPLSLTALYIAKFGGIGAVGQKISVRISPINSVSGQMGSGASASTDIVA